MSLLCQYDIPEDSVFIAMENIHDQNTCNKCTSTFNPGLSFMSIFLPQISDGSHLASDIIPAESSTDGLEEHLNQRPGCNLIYSISDRPPWYLCLLLGFQVRNFSSKLIWNGQWCKYVCSLLSTFFDFTDSYQTVYSS